MLKVRLGTQFVVGSRHLGLQPAAPLTLQTMSLSPELTAVLAKAGTPSEFASWLLKEECTDCGALAIMASREDLVETKIISACVATVRNAKEPGISVKITKAWRACRKVLA